MIKIHKRISKSHISREYYHFKIAFALRISQIFRDCAQIDKVHLYTSVAFLRSQYIQVRKI